MVPKKRPLIRRPNPNSVTKTQKLIGHSLKQPLHVLEEKLHALREKHLQHHGLVLSKREYSLMLALEREVARRHGLGFNPEHHHEHEVRHSKAFSEDPLEKAIKRNKRKKR